VAVDDNNGSSFTMSSYDGHFLLQFFCKEYTEYTMRTRKTAYANEGIIHLHGERNVLLRIGNIVFVDSCQFFATTLDNLVEEMTKAGVEKLAKMMRHFGHDDVYFEKGSPSRQVKAG